MLAQPLVRALLLTTILFNLFAPVLNAQMTLFATQDLGLSPFLLGLSFMVAGVVGVLASIVTGVVSSRLRMGGP